MRTAATATAAFLVLLSLAQIPVGDTSTSRIGTQVAAQAEEHSYEFSVLPGIQTLDAYLYLRRGSDTTGSALAENDDGEDGNDARIAGEQLDAGTYTVEATTYGRYRGGAFTLRIATGSATAPDPPPRGTGHAPPAGTCTEVLGPIAGSETRHGRWGQGCLSEVRTGSYSRYYTFTLGQSSTVTIDLVAWLDPDRTPINVLLTCGWHDACPDGANTEDGWGVDFGSHQRRDVWAAFRHENGNKALGVEFESLDDVTCRKVVGTVKDGDRTLATVRYTHVIGLRDKEGNAADLPDMLLNDATEGLHALRIGHVASKAEELGCYNAGFWRGSHLHQEVEPEPFGERSSCDDDGDVYCNRNDGSSATGIVERNFSACMSSSMWLFKIASTTPGTTATDTPTYSCPPTGLNLGISPGDPDRLRLTFEPPYADTYPLDEDEEAYYFKAPRVGKFELYRAVSPSGFCDADARDCLPVATATSAAPRAGDTYESYMPGPVSFDGLATGFWYRARGTGCTGTAPALTCGSWSAPL